jgi:hypothetical protein
MRAEADYFFVLGDQFENGSRKLPDGAMSAAVPMLRY